MAVANGQFLVVRRRAYDRAGGHAAVRDAVLDDVALARTLRRHGARGGLADGTDLAACRMYNGWVDLRDGYAKSLWAAFGSEPGAFAVLALLAVMYVIPPIAMARGSVVGTVGYLAGVTGRMLAARRSGARVWPDSVAHPLSVLVLGWLTTRSIVRRRRSLPDLEGPASRGRELMARIGVVGAGVGGLAAAARLAARGHTVNVFEASGEVGGKLGVIERRTDAGIFRFDTGPTVLTMPEVFAELFAATGDSIDKVLTLRELDPDDSLSLRRWHDPDDDAGPGQPSGSLRAGTWVPAPGWPGRR